MDSVVAIVGPTAVGKTAISVEVARRINGEIISADSMQVYRFMNIGTAKVSVDEMYAIPHHLIDLVDPTEEFSVARYKDLAQNLIRDINSRARIPILAGGTGLYVNAVLDDYNFSKFASDWDLRKALREEAEAKGSASLYDRLSDVDPLAASRIHVNDVRRIIRALEVYLKTGKSLTVWESERASRLPIYRQVLVGLTMSRECLYERIDNRVDCMITDGLLAEVKNLMDSGMSFIAQQALGYKEIIDFFEGRCTLDEAINIIKRETRRYAKRQLTWFRRDTRIAWFNWDEVGNIGQMTEQIVNYIEGHL